MGNFTYKDVYIEDGKKVLEVNVLPEKFCNFDCIFCPIGRSSQKADTQMTFEGFKESMQDFENMIEKTKPELIFINSKGEAFIHDRIVEIVAFIKSKNLLVKLLTNGYLLGYPAYREIANMCDEVIGEIKVITEEDFQKVQRPVEGYTLEKYISNMISFKKQYTGKFIFEITIVKGYNDDEESIKKLKEIITVMSPSKVIVVRMEDEQFKKKLGISDERYVEITQALSNE